MEDIFNDSGIAYAPTCVCVCDVYCLRLVAHVLGRQHNSFIDPNTCSVLLTHSMSPQAS